MTIPGPQQNNYNQQWQPPHHPNLTELAQLAALNRLQAEQAVATRQQAEANAAMLRMQYLSLTPEQRAQYDAEIAQQQAEVERQRVAREAQDRYQRELVEYNIVWFLAYALPLAAAGSMAAGIAKVTTDANVFVVGIMVALLLGVASPWLWKQARRMEKPAAPTPPAPVPPVNPDVVAFLHERTARQEPFWIGYVNPQGEALRASYGSQRCARRMPRSSTRSTSGPSGSTSGASPASRRRTSPGGRSSATTSRSTSARTETRPLPPAPVRAAIRESWTGLRELPA